jgi:hypothetical protein
VLDPVNEVEDAFGDGPSGPAAEGDPIAVEREVAPGYGLAESAGLVVSVGHLLRRARPVEIVVIPGLRGG